MIDMQAMEAHAERVGQKVQQRLSVLAERAQALRSKGDYTEEAVRSLSRDLRKVQADAVEEMVAVLKPLWRRCHHPAHRRILAAVEGKLRATANEAVRTHLGDTDLLDRQIDDAAAATDEFETLVSDILTKECA